MVELFQSLITAAISGLIMALFALPFYAMKKRQERKQKNNQDQHQDK